MTFFILLLLLVMGDSEGKIGNKCTGSSSCEDSYSLYEEECRDGICKCSPEAEMSYSRLLKPTCRHNRLEYFGSGCNSTSCGEGSQCVERPNPYLPSRNMTICICEEGFIRADGYCREAIYQSVLKPCRVPSSGPVLACDIDKYSHCKSGTCICFDSYFANISSGNCEPMVKYTKANKLKAYKVMPGEYCSQPSHCIDGLQCKKFRCACPFPCFYNKTEEVCDCGEIEEQPPPDIIGPIIVGVLLGFVIVSCWGYKIHGVIEKYTLMKNGNFVELDEDAPSPVSPTRQPMRANNSVPAGPPPTVAGQMHYPHPGMAAPPVSVPGQGYKPFQGGPTAPINSLGPGQYPLAAAPVPLMSTPGQNYSPFTGVNAPSANVARQTHNPLNGSSLPTGNIPGGIPNSLGWNTTGPPHNGQVQKPLTPPPPYSSITNGQPPGLPTIMPSESAAEKQPAGAYQPLSTDSIILNPSSAGLNAESSAKSGRLSSPPSVLTPNDPFSSRPVSAAHGARPPTADGRESPDATPPVSV